MSDMAKLFFDEEFFRDSAHGGVDNDEAEAFGPGADIQFLDDAGDG